MNPQTYDSLSTSDRTLFESVGRLEVVDEVPPGAVRMTFPPRPTQTISLRRAKKSARAMAKASRRANRGG